MEYIQTLHISGFYLFLIPLICGVISAFASHHGQSKGYTNGYDEGFHAALAARLVENGDGRYEVTVKRESDWE